MPSTAVKKTLKFFLVMIVKSVSTAGFFYGMKCAAY